MSKNVLDWSIKLQHELEKMSNEEFSKFMEDKAIKYEGKLYAIEKRDDVKGNGKTKRTVKGSNKRADVH